MSGIFQFEQAKALANAGNQIGVISVGFITLRHLLEKFPYERRECLAGLNVYRGYRRTLLIERMVGASLASKRYLKLFKNVYGQYTSEYGDPDLIHAHNFLYAGVLAKYVKEERGIPFVVTEHSSAFARGMISQESDKAIFEVCREAGALSCVSAALRDTLSQRYGYPFDVLPNIVDPIFFKDASQSVQEKEYTFINVASLDENKNQSLLICAFASRFKGLPAQLKIAGEGHLRGRLKYLAEKSGVGPQVKFLGRLSRSAVRDEMRSSNCFVLSSNYETFGVVLIEALASGIPLIATKCGGPEDIVNAGNGVLVDVGAEQQLATAMQVMFLNHSFYERKRLIAEAETYYGEGAFVKNTMNLYQEALGKGGPKPV